MQKKNDRIPVLSDHAYQSIQFQVIDPKTTTEKTTLCVGSWNLLNKGHSKQSNFNFKKDPEKAYTNNPYNIDESEYNYIKRKQQEIKLIEEKIQAGDDIVFLQEIDFLLTWPKDTSPTIMGLKKEFELMLSKHGYGLILTTPPQQQPLATIYNKNKLDLDSEDRVFLSKTKQYRGYESTFTLKSTGQKVVATNLHLLYGEDYKKQIEDYQKDKEAEDVFCIMGGDTNNVQDLNLNTGLSKKTAATNFSMDEDNIENGKEEKVDDKNKLTLAHKDPDNPEKLHVKSYDQFFVVPPKAHYVRATPTDRCTEVILENDAAKFIPLTAEHRRSKTTRVGERWRRNIHIIQELENRYKPALTSLQMEQKELLKELRAVIKFKKLNSDKISNPDLKSTYQEGLSYLDYYKHYVTDKSRLLFNKGRDHFFKIESAPNINLQGDALKSKILNDFYQKIDNISDIKQLKTEIDDFVKSDEYKILAKGQGITTRLFSLKTTSIEAFEKICQDKRDELEDNNNFKI